MKSFAAAKTSERLSESQRAALISLLADEDAGVHQTVRTKLLSFGEEVIDWLRPYTLSNEPLLRRRAQEIINVFGRKNADQQFMSFCGSRGEDLPLEEGVWLLASTQYPDINVTAYEALLDAFASVTSSSRYARSSAAHHRYSSTWPRVRRAPATSRLACRRSRTMSREQGPSPCRTLNSVSPPTGSPMAQSLRVRCEALRDL